MDARALKPLIYTPQSYLVEFDIDGKKEVGVMREVQFHPVKDTVLHVDFFHVVPGNRSQSMFRFACLEIRKV